MKLVVKPPFMALALLPCAAFAADADKKFDEISITATREARSTADVPQAISVVGKETMADKKMFNVKEALQEIPGVLIDSKNGGFDARLIIRGAGLKAPYGIREIMVLRDGVPLTDPDSFTRLDFVDTQDIERIEVAKGPGNLFATGSTGGTIQILSKSVFDKRANNLRIGFGNEGTENYHLRYGGMVGDNQALALTATYRKMDNDWRYWNQFDTTQTSLKHGLILGNGDILDSEISYAEANVQLPGAMDRPLFDQFLASGEQTATSEPWKHSGRYSKVLFLNSRLEMQRGDFTFKPRVYYNTWYHYHPVTGVINETNDWVWNLGTDLEAHWRHAQGTLVGGLTIRQERAPDSRKYQYRDVTTGFGGRITATRSDIKGALAEIDDATTLLTGVYLQESWRPTDRWIVDIGMRYDVATFEDNNNQIWKYDFATGKYIAGAGQTSLKKTFNLPAPKLAASYRLTETLNLFAMAAQAGQIPSSSEISNNPSIDAPVARNYEIGLKGRGGDWQFDTSLYSNPVSNEIVQQSNGGVTSYVNAGKTDKKGFEIAGSFGFARNWQAGGYYAYTRYKYADFSDPVRVGAITVNMDRAGKFLPFVPQEQYGLFLGWKQGSWRARLSSNTWGEYWLDNANTEKYRGWEWVTNLSIGYERNGHSLTLNADNLFDKLYAFEVKKDTTGKVTYTAAAPRSLMLTYRYDFR
ncbi:MAG: TonB-dependent receptor [Rhodocyclaceae bacterium]